MVGLGLAWFKGFGKVYGDPQFATNSIYDGHTDAQTFLEAFDRGTDPASGSPATDYIEHAPSELLGWRYADIERRFFDADESVADAPFRLEQWSMIADKLRSAQEHTVRLANRCCDFVTEAVERYDLGLFEGIRVLREVERGSFIVEVAAAGTRREARLTGSQVTFLAGATREDSAATYRAQYQGLVTAIPELRPFFRVIKSTDRDDNRSRYSLDSRVRPRIVLPG